MNRYLSPAQVAERRIPGIQHKVTVIRKLESQELCGFQSKKGGRWAVPEQCLESYVQGRLCEHRSNIVELTDRRRLA